MSVNVTTPPVSNPVYLFANQQEAQDFFSNLEVPSASQVAEGVVRQAATQVYTGFVDYTNDSYTTLEVWKADDSVTTITIPDQVMIAEMKDKLLALNTAFNELLTKLKNAGIVAAS